MAWTGIENFCMGRFDPPPPADEPEDIEVFFLENLYRYDCFSFKILFICLFTKSGCLLFVYLCHSLLHILCGVVWYFQLLTSTLALLYISLICDHDGHWGKNTLREGVKLGQ